MSPFSCTSRRVIHDFESSREEKWDRLSWSLFFLRSSALLRIVGGESCEEARSGLTSGLTWVWPLSFLIEVKSDLAAWGETQERLSILEPELIALNLRGVAHAYERASIPAEQGITKALFLGQPPLFRFPCACPSSQLFTPLDASIQEALSQKGIQNGERVKIRSARGEIQAVALVTARFKPFQVEGKTVHQIGMPWHFGWGGLANGEIANDLTPHVGDGNTTIPEYKAFLVDVQKA